MWEEVPADSLPTTKITGSASLIAVFRCCFAVRRNTAIEGRGAMAAVGFVATPRDREGKGTGKGLGRRFSSLLNMLIEGGSLGWMWFDEKEERK